MSLAAITARPRALLVKRSEAWTCDESVLSADGLLRRGHQLLSTIRVDTEG